MNDFSDIPTRVIRPHKPTGMASASELSEQAYASSRQLIGLLTDAASVDAEILLLVNDSHRATQTRIALLTLSEILKQHRLHVRCRVLVATGVHRSSDNEKAEFEKAQLAEVGLDIDGVHWHAADDLQSLALHEGRRFNELVLQAEFVLAIGSVEPHYFAGVTGAHKTLTIGCMSREDIEHNHANAMNERSDILVTRGNPVFEGIEDAVRSLAINDRRIVAVNQVVCGANILAVSVGDAIETLSDLMPIVRETFVITVEEPADLVHLRVPQPLGRSFYQADKALKNNHQAVRDGGGILLEAECPEGIGDDAFFGLLRSSTGYLSACETVEERGYRLGDHKAVKLRYLTDPAYRGVHVAMVTKQVSEADARAAGMQAFASLDDAKRWLDSVVEGPREQAIVVDDAGFVTVSPRGAD